MFDAGIFIRMEIFHIAEPNDWAARTNIYLAPSLETEGFIHCSTAEQVGGVAATFFAGREDLMLLTIDSHTVEELLLFEDLYEMGEKFPHIYGPLPVTAIVTAVPFPGV